MNRIYTIQTLENHIVLQSDRSIWERLVDVEALDRNTRMTISQALSREDTSRSVMITLPTDEARAVTRLLL